MPLTRRQGIKEREAVNRPLVPNLFIFVTRKRKIKELRNN
jgi:hypothetical protein